MSNPLQDNFIWKLERIGKVTGSRVADIVAKTKSGYSASRANYLGQLVAERLTGVSNESSFSSAAMDWGVHQEAKARAAYAFYRDVDVELSGFVPHPEIEMAGASPDGLIGSDGLVELKCPNTATHIDTLIGQTIPTKYQVQMLWQMACSGRSWCDFVSFDPRLPDTIAVVVLRLERDEARIKELEEEVKVFLFEVETTVRRLSRPAPPPPTNLRVVGDAA